MEEKAMIPSMITKTQARKIAKGEVKIPLCDLKSLSSSLEEIKLKLHDATGIVSFYLEQQEDQDD